MSEPNPFVVPSDRGPQAGSGSPAGRSVEMGQGLEWLKDGWQLFLKNPGVWIAMAIIAFVIFVALNLIPVVGHLGANLLGPVIGAGMLIGARALAQGEELKVEHLFAGFKQNTGNLIVLGVLWMVGMIVLMAIVFVIGGGAAITGGMMGHAPGVGMAVGGLFLALLVGLALSVPLAMAMWFAPALVVFRNTAPVEALKTSFNACLKNLGPFLIYGVLLLVASVVAAIPLGLGFILLLPVAAGSVYASYVDIFERV
jgi:uncharacterized membrane protein